MSSIPPVPTAPTGNTRRARLARLREEAEPLVAGERRAALRALLQQPLLTPDGAQAEMFALVRRHRDWLATWFAHHANWSLSITAEVARLRKIPATTTDSSRGAIDARSEESFTRTRYVLLCLALAALERSDRQITLGRLAEAVTNSLAADPGFAEAGFVWSLDNIAGRRDFVHALRLLLALGVLRRVQGDEEHFLHDRGSDALYNVARPVLAALLVCRRSPAADLLQVSHSATWLFERIHLVIMKVIAHRDKNMQDVEGLLDAHPDMNVEEIRQILHHWFRLQFDPHRARSRQRRNHHLA